MGTIGIKNFNDLLHLILTDGLVCIHSWFIVVNISWESLGRFIFEIWLLMSVSCWYSFLCCLIDSLRRCSQATHIFCIPWRSLSNSFVSSGRKLRMLRFWCWSDFGNIWFSEWYTTCPFSLILLCLSSYILVFHSS